jgi:hypothetical protein
MPEFHSDPAASLTLNPRLTRILAAVLLAVLAILLIASARQESQTFDESTHLAAGFAYWKHRDFGRNPEHPPFIKLLAAMPLLPLGLEEPSPIPIPFFKAEDLVNGARFIYAPGVDGNVLLFRGRVVIMLFSLGLGLLLFLATREIFGPLASLFALLLFVFQPLLLGNGNTVTTDMPLACLLFASVYTFYRFCNHPTAPRFALCALAVCLTLITKHSGILVLPILVLLTLADLLFPGADDVHLRVRKRHIRRIVLAVCAIFGLGYLALWAIYGFRYAARPGQLQIVPPMAAYAAGLTHPLEQHLILFFARHHLFPEAYLYGWVDILLIPAYRPTFLLGHLYNSAQWFFFPAVFLIKTTLTLLVFLLLLPFARIDGHRRQFVFFAIPAAFFFIVSIVSLMNGGARYLIPMYPYCILLAAAAAGAFFQRSTISRATVAALLLFALISTLHSYPNFLAYSNELFGGPSRTYRSLADPDADWGQGLKWTHTYLTQHPDANCWFDYYGNPMMDFARFGVPCKPLLSSFQHLIGMGTRPIPSTISGTILVSSSDIDGLWWGPGTLNPYQPFRDRTPDAIIGNIILVYHGTFDVPLLAGETNAAAATGLLRQHRLPEALALAQTAVQEAPDSADIHAVLGQILLASGRIPEGQQAMAEALHLAQTNYPDFQKYLIEEIQRPAAHS